MQRVLYFILILPMISVSLHGQLLPTKGFTPSPAEFGESRESRRQTAADWLTEIEELFEQMPTLSPAEREWLKVEYDDEIARNNGYLSARSIRAQESREFAIRDTYPNVERLRILLQQLASPDNLTPEGEMVRWTVLVAIALDVELWRQLVKLGELGVLEQSSIAEGVSISNSNYINLIVSMWGNRARQILLTLIVPYLQAQGNP